MIELDRSLIAALEAMSVAIEVPDRNTVVLRNVPVGPGFNKEATSVLVKRLRGGRPLLICTDDDLRYVGGDRRRARVFEGEVRREGWQVLYLGPRPPSDVQGAVRGALAALGTGGSPGAAAEAESSPPGLLDRFARDLSDSVRELPRCPLVGREEELAQVVSCVLRWSEARLAVIAGEAGVGRTRLVEAVAEKLADGESERAVLGVDLAGPLSGALFEADRETRLAELLEEAAARPKVLLALEHLELALSLVHGAMLLSQFLDRGGALVGTTLPRYVRGLRHGELTRRVQVVGLEELSARETLEVLGVVRERMASHHGVEIGSAALPTCVKAAGALRGRYPAKAVALLDAAAARAALGGTPVVGADDVCFAARSFPCPADEAAEDSGA